MVCPGRYIHSIQLHRTNLHLLLIVEEGDLLTKTLKDPLQGSYPQDFFFLFPTFCRGNVTKINLMTDILYTYMCSHTYIRNLHTRMCKRPFCTLYVHAHSREQTYPYKMSEIKKKKSCGYENVGRVKNTFCFQMHACVTNKILYL